MISAGCSGCCSGGGGGAAAESSGGGALVEGPAAELGGSSSAASSPCSSRVRNRPFGPRCRDCACVCRDSCRYGFRDLTSLFCASACTETHKQRVSASSQRHAGIALARARTFARAMRRRRMAWYCFGLTYTGCSPTPISRSTGGVMRAASAACCRGTRAVVQTRTRQHVGNAEVRRCVSFGVCLAGRTICAWYCARPP